MCYDTLHYFCTGPCAARENTGLPGLIAEKGGTIPCPKKHALPRRSVGRRSNTARFRLTPVSYTQLNLIVQRRSQKKRRLVTILLATGLTLLYCMITHQPLHTTLLLIVTESIVVWPLSSLMDKWFLKLYAQRSQKLSPAALDEQYFEFYEDGFQVNSHKAPAALSAMTASLAGTHR